MEAKPSLQENRRELRDTQTCNTFEASAAHTPGQRSGASEGSLRRKMRTRPGQQGLAVHASGEQVQIAALLGGSEARRTGPESSNHLSLSNPLVTTLQRRRSIDFCQGIEPSPWQPAQLLIDDALGRRSRVMSTNPSFLPPGLGWARRKTSIPSL